MVQTRSKFRLLQQAVTGALPEKQSQSPPKTSKEKEHKKKKNNARQSLQSSLSPPVNLFPAIHPSEAADDTANTCGEEQEYMNIPSSAPHQQSFDSSVSVISRPLDPNAVETT
jgi:hypothetical protein